MTPISTRQKIFSYLQEQRQASAPQLSQALGMTRADMRYHLDKLLEEGLVESEAAPATKGRGRPIHIYHLAAATRPNNLAQLSSALLVQMLSSAGSENIDQSLRSLAGAMAGSEELPRHLTQRLTRLMQWLNHRRYQARWEARLDAPQILFRNCPYAAILPNHPELCRLDALLLEHFTAAPVEQVAKIDLDRAGVPACIFVLDKPSETMKTG